MQRSTRRLVAVDVFLALSFLTIAGSTLMFRMPGRSYEGELPAATERQRQLSDELRDDVEMLAGEYPDRDVSHMRPYRAARDFIDGELREAGYDPSLEQFEVRGETCANVVVEREGTTHPEQVVLVGAHYDSVPGSPGADDNASGVAGLLALARRFSDSRFERTVRLVFFANEEAPYFHTDAMGSLRHARRCRARETEIELMISLEMLGYYDDSPGSQSYPPVLSWFYPDRGNFIGFVGNFSSRRAVKRTVGAFRESVDFPSYGFAGPGFVPGVNLSDHSAFWKVGYPALMVTDTAYNRNPHYHRATDTPETIDYDRFARVVDGLGGAIATLADSAPTH